MRQDKLFELIMDTAKNDSRIRVVAMTGSRIDPNAAHDEFCDFDIVYLVTDIQSFTGNDDWLEIFGDKLIMQKPSDWYTMPYNYSDFENFTYLIHLKDGNRIDLTLIDLKNIHSYILDKQPRTILLDKDKIIGLNSTGAGDYFSIKKPTPEQFRDVCNEFWWMVPNIVKGLCRKQLPYVKFVMERYAMDMLLEVLNWSIGIDSDFSVGTGKWCKYLEKHMKPEEHQEYVAIFSNGSYLDIWYKLSLMCLFFQKKAIKVANHFDFHYNELRANDMLQYANNMKCKYYGEDCNINSAQE
ncbi:MAG: adenylyltransferase [Anaerocolumna sp.]|nr:adenylyltransferase [Anaerocolumna sp.]